MVVVDTHCDLLPGRVAVTTATEVDGSSVVVSIVVTVLWYTVAVSVRVSVSVLVDVNRELPGVKPGLIFVMQTSVLPLDDSGATGAASEFSISRADSGVILNILLYRV